MPISLADYNKSAPDKESGWIRRPITSRNQITSKPYVGRPKKRTSTIMLFEDSDEYLTIPTFREIQLPAVDSCAKHAHPPMPASTLPITCTISSVDTSPLEYLNPFADLFKASINDIELLKRTAILSSPMLVAVWLAFPDHSFDQIVDAIYMGSEVRYFVRKILESDFKGVREMFTSVEDAFLLSGDTLAIDGLIHAKGEEMCMLREEYLK